MPQYKPNGPHDYYAKSMLLYDRSTDAVSFCIYVNYYLYNAVMCGK